MLLKPRACALLAFCAILYEVHHKKVGIQPRQLGCRHGTARIRCWAPGCGAVAAGRRASAAVDRFLLPTGRSAANPPLLRSNDATDGVRTDAGPFHGPCQCRIKVGAIDAAALGPLKKSVTATDEKMRKVISIFSCDFSGWYNFGKINKIVATGCHILKVKCTKFDFGWGSAPDSAGGAYSAPPDPLAGFKGPTSKGK